MEAGASVTNQLSAVLDILLPLAGGGYLVKILMELYRGQSLKVAAYPSLLDIGNGWACVAVKVSYDNLSEWLSHKIGHIYVEVQEAAPLDDDVMNSLKEHDGRRIALRKVHWREASIVGKEEKIGPGQSGSDTLLLPLKWEIVPEVMLVYAHVYKNKKQGRGWSDTALLGKDEVMPKEVSSHNREEQAQKTPSQDTPDVGVRETGVEEATVEKAPKSKGVEEQRR